MIPTIDVRASMDRVTATLGLMDREAKKAAVRAMNKTLVTARAEAARMLAPQYQGLKIGSIKSRMTIKRATNAAPTAVLMFKGSRIPLYGNFGMRVIKPGKRAKGRRGAGLRGGYGVAFSKLPWRVEDQNGQEVSAEMIARAFRNRLRAGGRATALARMGSERYPVAVLLAPALSRTVVEKGIGSAMEKFGRARFAEAYMQEVRFLLSQGA